jgi:hypothetical protein
MVVCPDESKADHQVKAKEILVELKERWGLTWPQISKFIPYPATSLRAYASDGEYTPAMPQALIDILLQLEDAPGPELDLPSGSLAVAIVNGKVHLIQLELRTCRFCGKPFAPEHPQQEYCDTYAGECGLAMRRKRYREENNDV